MPDFGTLDGVLRVRAVILDANHVRLTVDLMHNETSTVEFCQYGDFVLGHGEEFRFGPCQLKFTSGPADAGAEGSVKTQIHATAFIPLNRRGKSVE